MAAEYPKTPRDVAKLHNRYFKAFYGQKLADDELDAMNKKVRQLYCTDLLVANPESDSLANLQKDIEAVKEQGYTYKMCITINTGDNLGYFYRQYAMVKENDQWKIYGWTESQLPSGSATTQAVE